MLLLCARIFHYTVYLTRHSFKLSYIPTNQFRPNSNFTHAKCLSAKPAVFNLWSVGLSNLFHDGSSIESLHPLMIVLSSLIYLDHSKKCISIFFMESGSKRARRMSPGGKQSHSRMRVASTGESLELCLHFKLLESKAEYDGKRL